MPAKGRKQGACSLALNPGGSLIEQLKYIQQVSLSVWLFIVFVCVLHF